jgi:hypothetical protein
MDGGVCNFFLIGCGPARRIPGSASQPTSRKVGRGRNSLHSSCEEEPSTAFFEPMTTCRYGFRARRFAAPRNDRSVTNSARRANHFVFTESCQASKSKIFRFTGILICGINCLVPRPRRDVSRSSRYVGRGMRWPRQSQVQRLGFRKGSRPGAGRKKAADGEIVWSWRRDPGAKPVE